MRRHPRVTTVLIALAVALALAVPATVSATASVTARPAHGRLLQRVAGRPAGQVVLHGDSSISVFLRAPDPRALADLAERPTPTGAGRAVRLREVSQLVPSAAQRDRVVTALRRAGATVTSVGTWSITARIPAARVGARYSAANRTGELTWTSGRGAPLAAVRGSVSGVYLTSTGHPVFHHSATRALDGTDIRYADSPAGVTPSTGQHDSGLTIATLQLARFKSADLTAYAKLHHLTDPVAAGLYHAINVDGGAQPDDSQGDVEVALDQESILSTAPTASQQAFFAPNTNAGYADVFSQVFDDLTGSGSFKTPNPGLVAMSISWGSCETLTGAHPIAMLEPILASLVAAGVTIFSAAGDDGIYDCGSGNGKGTDDRHPDVDYPGSSPEVVSVGGSLLQSAASAPNNGTNWTESVWSCGGPAACEGDSGSGGGGGGVSGSAYGLRTLGVTDRFKGFPEPLWQAKTLTTAPYASVTHRMVPDIVTTGDPDSGLLLYSSDADFDHDESGKQAVVGGTSLATPLSAAQLTNTLGDSGTTFGVGDIHPALYSAFLDSQSLATNDTTKGFRDVTKGSNGNPADKGLNPSVSATTGYDTASGLGAVLWSATLPYLLDKTDTPLIEATVTTSQNSVSVTWDASQGSDLIRIAATGVEVLVQGQTQPIALFHTASGTQTVQVPNGTAVKVVVASEDIARSLADKQYTLTVGGAVQGPSQRADGPRPALP